MLNTHQATCTPHHCSHCPSHKLLRNGILTARAFETRSTSYEGPVDPNLLDDSPQILQRRMFLCANPSQKLCSGPVNCRRVPGVPGHSRVSQPIGQWTLAGSKSVVAHWLAFELCANLADAWRVGGSGDDNPLQIEYVPHGSVSRIFFFIF